jgi:hypothetical protein
MRDRYDLFFVQKGLPSLPLRDKGRTGKVTEEKLKEAFSSLGSKASRAAVEKYIGVKPDTVKVWHQRNCMTWKQVQELFGG